MLRESSGFVIACHGGAGYHSVESEPGAVNAVTRACEAARQALEGGASSLDAVVAAMSVMEDDPACNAGRGSNLTFEGGVECDASVMDASSGAFGACGAVPCVRNPCRLAAALLKQRVRGPGPLQLVPPLLLTGEGARRWAEARGLDVTEPSELVTAQARASWRRYRAMLRAELADREAASRATEPLGAAAEVAVGAPSGTRGLKRPPESPASGDGASAARRGAGRGGGRDGALTSRGCDGSSADGLSGERSGGVADASWLNDTVGAVVCDGRGELAAGVSSGGAWLKHSGRVGEAASFGAGCWAEGACVEQRRRGQRGVGVSVSGVGEQVVQAMVAREAAAALTRPAVASARAVGGDDGDCSAAGLGGGGGTDDSECHADEVALRVLSDFCARCGPPAVAPGMGFIALRGESRCASIVFAHNTPSMAVAYQHHGMATPRALVSRSHAVSAGGDPRSSAAAPLVHVTQVDWPVAVRGA